jgi:uncharacterized Fe-S center protein
MKSELFFLPVKHGEDPSSIAKGLKKLFEESGAGGHFAKGDHVGVKTHFGEHGNTTFLHPVLVKSVVDRLLQAGVRPFLTETSTLYRGRRTNAHDHICLAQEHGFGFERMKVPIIMADGLYGDAEVAVNIASEIAKMQGLVILSHLTGHMLSGFGCAIKSIGMGLASRKGKLKQHSIMSPEIITRKCTACGMCIQWCPKDTIALVSGKAFIHKENCIGCGECLAVCRYDAVRYDWNMESNTMQEMMAEHAAGVIKAVKGKIFFFNFLINITRDCDCGNGGESVSKDVGILAGGDIVAMEKATSDLFARANERSLRECTYPNVDPMIQVRHAEHLGLGSADYRLVELSRS